MNSVFCSRSRAVSSRGCSKAFIVCVLHRALQYVRQLHIGAIYPFRSNLVEMWLELAKADCGAGAFKNQFWGTEFDLIDPSTYWIDPQQFFTWWKNNVERKCKFQSLRRDASYDGESEKQHKRAFFCNVVIALAINIRNHFERHRIPGQPVPQVMIPINSNFLSSVSYPEPLDDESSDNDTTTDSGNKRRKRYKKTEKINCHSSKRCQMKCINKELTHPQYLSSSTSSMATSCHHCSHKCTGLRPPSTSSAYTPINCNMYHQSNIDSVGELSLQKLRQSLKFVATENILRKKLKLEDFSNDQLLQLKRIMMTEDNDQYSSEMRNQETSFHTSQYSNNITTATATATGYLDRKSTLDPVPFSVAATATPTTSTATTTTSTSDEEEPLDISNLDFDALICEGSEVDWIDDDNYYSVSDDGITTDIESSFTSHNNSFYQYHDSEESVPSSSNSTTATATNYNNYNYNSFGNLNEYFSKKMSLKRSFGDLTDIDIDFEINKELCDSDSIDNNRNRIQSIQKVKIPPDNTISSQSANNCLPNATLWPAVRITYGDLLKDPHFMTSWGGKDFSPIPPDSDDRYYADFSGFDALDSDSLILEYFEV